MQQFLSLTKRTEHIGKTRILIIEQVKRNVDFNVDVGDTGAECIFI